MAEKQHIENPLKPREYQLELLNYVCHRNAIIYLPTGAGKTFIAILALKHFSSQLQETIKNGGKRAIFMCNTVELARQQYKHLKQTTNLKIGLYIGERDIDNWSRREWEVQIENNQVLVGTAQVFLDIINQNLMNITDLSIVVIDECHHATGNHPMHAFLSAFQHCDQRNLPRVIGLTGVIIKGNKFGKIIEDLKDLEATFRGNIVTICDIEKMKNVMVYSTKPKEEMVLYSSNRHVFNAEDNIKIIINQCKTVIDNFDIGSLEQKFSKNLGSLREPNKKKVIKNFFVDFEYQMQDLGLYGASLAIMSVIIEFEVNKRQAATIALKNLYRYVIQCCDRIRHVIVKTLLSLQDDEDYENHKSQDNLCHTLLIMENFSTPKLRSLFKYMKDTFAGKAPDDIACLLFVERRYTAKCLYYIIKKYVSQIPELKNVIRPNFMVGRQSIKYSIESILDSKWNVSAITEFRSKQCNFIICSNVLEEGIDVQACNYVFVFDQLKTFNSYIQSKGRARSQNSCYAIFAEETEKMNTLQKIQLYRQTHEIIQKFLTGRALDRDDPTEEEIAKQFTELIPPYITPHGARLTATSALPLLHRYCHTLPWDSYGSSQPWYTKLQANARGQLAVSVSLPLQSSVRGIITSDYFPSIKEAKISAAFKTCVKLYEQGELNEKLLPISKTECVANLSNHLFQHWKKYNDNVTKFSVGKQMKRTYEREYPNEFKNSLPRIGEKAYAYTIVMSTDFQMNTYNEHVMKCLYSKRSYAILLNKKLPKLAKMPLFMSQGKLYAQVSETPIEYIVSSQDQLNQLIQFHTMIFKDLLKLWKEFLVIDRRNEENSYLIVPMDEMQTIDWTLIKEFQHLDSCRPYTVAERQNARYHPQDYLNKVVTKWYTEFQAESFVVTKVHEDMTPMSPFDTPQYETYAEFYSSRYNVHVQQKNQFLLEVKSLTHRRNFFNNASNKSTERKREGSKTILIPEFCHNYKYPADLWLKALLLPTILHRVYYMLHAESLRRTINKFLNLDKFFTNYTPKPLIIDESLKRVLDDDGNLVKAKEHRKTVLASLPTKKQSTDQKKHHLDQDDNMWKEYLEPVDICRNISQTYSVEIDYYHKFVMSLLPEMENLKITDEIEYTKSQFEMPTISPQRNKAGEKELSNNFQLAIKCSTDPPNIDIEMLKRNLETDDCLKSAEQYEFLAAITSAKVNDVFDMERFELLGDAFLKFSTSLYLANKYTKWHEGFLTIVKSRMVSNRNLLYCMKDTKICQMICSSLFNPNAGWLPPLASLPSNLLELLREKLPPVSILSPSDFYSLQLTDEERFSGKCYEHKLEPFAQACIKCKELATVNVDMDDDNDMNLFINKDVVRDKVVADTLEALLGVCVKNYGIHRSFRMLEFFGICKSDSPNSHYNLLDLKLSSQQLRANISKTEVDGFLINYEYLEQNLGYTFQDRAFLLQALTHPSYPTNRLTGCYQELEFIGDAILDMLITCYIFERFQHKNPGKITDLRMALVNNITLGSICVRHKFHLFLLSENSALSEAITSFVNFQETQNYRVTDQVRILMEEHTDDINPFNDILSYSNKESDSSESEDDEIMMNQDNENADNSAKSSNQKTYNISQHVDVPKALGDIVEALIAAVYLDCRDLNTTWKIIHNLMKIELEEFAINAPIDPVRQLEENNQAKPKYSIPVIDNNDVLVKCIFNVLDKTFTTNGFGCNAKQAKKAAAKQALQIISKYAN